MDYIDMWSLMVTMRIRFSGSSLMGSSTKSALIRVDLWLCLEKDGGSDK